MPMHTLLVLLRKDFTNFFRNKAAVSLTFLVPFAMIYVFGQVFGVSKTDRGPTGIPVAVVNASDHSGGAALVAALQAEKAFRVITDFKGVTPADTRPLQEADLRALMHENKFRFALVIPADLVRTDRISLHLKIYSNPRNEIETQMVNGILQKTIFSSVPQLMGQSLQANAVQRVGRDKLSAFNRTNAQNIAATFGGKEEDILRHLESGNFGPDGLAAAATSPGNQAAAPTQDLLSKLVRIDQEQVAGRNVKSPAATRLVGGFAMQFLLFALSASAAALFYERDRGIFHRILAGPVFRSQILWSKFLYGSALGLLQLTVLFFGGRLLFGIDVEHHLPLLLVTCVFAAAACTSFGMLLASVAPSMEAANGLSTFVILLMCSVGGAWFPVSLMPEFIQQLSRLTIVYWAMEGFDQVLWLNGTIRDLAPTLGVLAGITAVIMSIAVWRFNRGNLFT